MNSTHLRDRFTADGLATASGPRVVVMAYDRLDRDLSHALVAIEARDVAGAHDALCHAQDLVTELVGMLDVEAWEHGRALAAIYRYVIEVLTRANIKKDSADVIEAQRLLAELGGAFRDAAVATVSATPRPDSGEPQRGISFRA